ncbi:MAG: hypothetical protein J0H74_08330 [Chitinophagaceae bacterium]|nr:hypothetical protein [Chitinophagaceae bacterium]
MCCKELRDRLGGKNDCYAISTVASEKGRQFRLNLTAGKTVCKVKIDACLIDDPKIAKCDYLIKVRPDDKYFLVELKETDVEHAVEQIVKTFYTVNQLIKASPQHFTGHIISSAIPRAAEQKFRNLKEKTLRKNKLNIVKHSFKCELSM